jgi:hypothetical protein
MTYRESLPIMAGHERDVRDGLTGHLRIGERDVRAKANTRPLSGSCFDVSEGSHD